MTEALKSRSLTLAAVASLAATREDLAGLTSASASRSFGHFGVGIGPDDKAPERYVVSVRQGGLGLNRDYYVTPRLAEKHTANFSHPTNGGANIGGGHPGKGGGFQLLRHFGWHPTASHDPGNRHGAGDRPVYGWHAIFRGQGRRSMSWKSTCVRITTCPASRPT